MEVFMKYCRNCGAQMDDESVYCQNCGANNGTEEYGNNQQVNDSSFDNINTNIHSVPSDGSNTGFNVLSFFFPLVGLILYLSWKNSLPLRAKGCGKWALIGFICNIVIEICFFFIALISAANGL